jgi:hypothetical protein
MEQQIRWQVHEDGVDYENSVSYHRLVTELFLVAFIFARRNGADFSSSYRERLNGMLDFMLAYSRDDGSTPLVSDADDSRFFRLDPVRRATDHRDTLALGGAALDRDDLKAAAGRCPPEVCWLLGPDAAAELADAGKPSSGSILGLSGGRLLCAPRARDPHVSGRGSDRLRWGCRPRAQRHAEFRAVGAWRSVHFGLGTYCYTSDQAQQPCLCEHCRP